MLKYIYIYVFVLVLLSPQGTNIEIEQIFAVEKDAKTLVGCIAVKRFYCMRLCAYIYMYVNNKYIHIYI